METLTYWASYFAYGAGGYMNRWCCSGFDAYLAVVMNAGCGWMAYEYMRYALSNHQLMKKARDSAFRRHSYRLRNVFIECGAIHILSSMVCWFIPAYWLIALLHFHNAWATRRLVNSATERAALVEHQRGLKAVTVLDRFENQVETIFANESQESARETERQYASIVARLRAAKNEIQTGDY